MVFVNIQIEGTHVCKQENDTSESVTLLGCVQMDVLLILEGKVNENYQRVYWKK